MTVTMASHPQVRGHFKDEPVSDPVSRPVPYVLRITALGVRVPAHAFVHRMVPVILAWKAPWSGYWNPHTDLILCLYEVLK
jgi:hypothetical protein